MNVADAEALLTELAASTSGVTIEVGTRGQRPHDYAYLKLTTPSDPEDFAVVSTRGDGWFELGVAGGFLTGTTSDLTPDEDVRENLERYLSAAIAYLGGRRSIGRSRLLKIPFVIVQTDDEALKLSLSVRDTLQHILSFKRS